MARQFCPYWDCLRPMCILHCMGLYSIFSLFHEYLLTFRIVYGPFEPRPPKRPTLNSSKLRDKTIASSKGPCSPGCFLHITNVHYMGQISGAEDIQSLLEMNPDASPCDLAVILKLECEKIFAHRCRLWQDDFIEPESNRSVTKRVRLYQFVENSLPLIEYTLLILPYFCYIAEC